MKKESFFILVLIVCGVAMILRTFFGGGGKDNSEIISSAESGFIEQLIDTGSDTNSQSEIIDLSNTGNNTQSTEYTEIRVMMPQYFYTAGWKNFAEDLYNNQKVYMKFTFIEDLNSYRDSLSDNNFNEADLFLFPYDRIDEIQTRDFSFQQNIQSVFDQLVAPIVNDGKNSFMPFAADPMVMYTSAGYEEQNSFADIFNFTQDRTPKKIAISFPLFFGITDEDYYDEGFSREYQDIVWYALMHYFTTYRDTKSLQSRIDSNVLQNYTVANSNTLLSTTSQTQQCKNFVSICFQLYNFTAIRFGFLSDADIVKQYFNNKKSAFEKISKIRMPFYTIESPVRLRGRSMPRSLEDVNKINGVYAFLIQYMNNHDQYSLRSSTLSVFAGNGGSTLMDNEFIGTRGYILKTGGNYISNIRNTKAFRQLVGYQISAKDYMKKI